MGLAASQARLLTITSRKSRAQFESMRMSHQKLTLSRSLTEISNEYQNSLDQTKLYYDFYGVNSTDTPLTYNMLMSPSSLNDYTPTLISNNQGQIVLSSPYAAAARAAGIPQEGLGCTPSSSLAEQGVITQGTAESICAIDYNQGAGLGGDNLVNTVTTTGSYQDLLNLLDGGSNTSGVTLADVDILANSTGQTISLYRSNNGSRTNVTSSEDLAAISLADLLNGTVTDLYLVKRSSSEGIHEGWKSDMSDVVNNTQMLLEQLGSVLCNVLDGAEDAVAYANSQMKTYCFGSDVDASGNYNTLAATAKSHEDASRKNDDHVIRAALGLVDGRDNDLLTVAVGGRQGGLAFGDKANAHAAINLADFVKAWFTYFMQYMMGLGSAKSNSLSVKWNESKRNSNFASAESIGDYEFTLTTTTVSDSDALISNFYDTLFNQICINGWTENNQVATDSSYLKEMLQSGQMYLTSMSDDYYYYQNNYATNNFVKEVSDDAAIAAAESKYTTQKARINAKEQELDLKMKNLDTEISSLETEYEAIKKVIEDNVSKSFTRYDS